MKTNILGKTGFKVSELCFGALPLGPLQKNVDIDTGSDIIVKAVQAGVNFIDTAQMYKTYEYIKKALKRLDRNNIFIATKSTAVTYEDMEKAIYQALDEMEIDYIDIFHLHSARAGVDLLEQRKDAYKCLLDYKKKGIIKAIGVSTHSVPLVNKIAEVDEIDVVYPIININGLGLIDGTVDEMIDAIKKCSDNNKGIYLMKILGGGRLINNFYKALDFALTIKGWASISIGMVSMKEVDNNLKFFNSSWKNRPKVNSKDFNKYFKVLDFICISCGNCINKCPNNAISLDKNNKAFINTNICLCCGYCVPECPQFAIRMI